MRGPLDAVCADALTAPRHKRSIAASPSTTDNLGSNLLMIPTKSKLWLAGVGLASLALVGTANAACSIDLSAPNAGFGHQHASSRPAGLTATVFHPDAVGGAHLIAVDDDHGFPASIVGLWKFKFSPELGGDFGTVIWHEDGTEIMISAARDPAAGDVCMGVWKQTGRHTYELNHIAMGHDGPPGGPPSPTFTNTVHLHEHIKLDPSGDSYTGQITAVISAANPADPFDESNVIARVSGTITATRVEP